MSLYRSLLTAAGSIKDKNFRCYFERIVRDDFSKNNIDCPEFIKKQEENLALLKRQSIVQNMYYEADFAQTR